jgi:hypothetical protein
MTEVTLVDFRARRRLERSVKGGPANMEHVLSCSGILLYHEFPERSYFLT